MGEKCQEQKKVENGEKGSGRVGSTGLGTMTAHHVLNPLPCEQHYLGFSELRAI